MNEGNVATRKTDSPTGISLQPAVIIRTTCSGEVVMNCTQTEVKNVYEVLELLISGNT
jgi:hypothetical protein